MTRTGSGIDSPVHRPKGVIETMAAIGFVAVVVTAVFADYVSSWLPNLGGFAAGAILRDGIAGSFLLLAGAVLVRDASGWTRASVIPGRSPPVAAWAFIPFVLFVVWVVLLVPPSPAAVPAVLAARNLALYTAVGFGAYVLVRRGHLTVGHMAGTIALVGFLAAGLGILDTATHGKIVTDLGFRRDYSGVEGSENFLIAGASSEFQGYVRASGGISNALVFGYLMAAIAVFATWMLEQTVIRSGWATRTAMTYVALGIVAGVACIESLTRGAIGALVVGLLLLVVLRRSRPIVIGSVATIVLAFSLAWLGSGFIPAPTAGSPPAPTLIDLVGSRVTSSDTTSQVSSTMRLDQVRLGLDSLAGRPMGNGLGTEGSASTRIGDGGVDLAPDIYLLEVALQTGLVGLILYATIFAAMIVGAVRAPNQSRALVLAMLLIFGIASVLSASPDAPVFATITWLLILAASALPARDGHSPDGRATT